MNEQLRKWKLIGLDRRIQLTRQALDRCHDRACCNQASKRTLNLVHQINRLTSQRDTLRSTNTSCRSEKNREMLA